MKLLHVRNLSISFGNIPVVNNISFSISKGEIAGIVGESGSGKSMTALSLMGLCPPGAKVQTDGGIEFQTDQKKISDISEFSEKQFRNIRGNQISMIFQEPMTSLNAVQKCGLQVAEILRIHKNAKRKEIYRKVIELFHEVLLPDPETTFQKYPHQLSGGQRQRVMIAMALACNPQLLIADEPTTALDVTVQKTILSLLKSLQQKYGMSILFISHDLGVISEICDRILVMHKGKIVEEQSSSQLLSNQVEHPYTKGLLACRPPENTRPYRLQTVGDYLSGNVSHAKIQSEKKVFSDNEIILEVQSLSKHFPMGKNFNGKVTSWFKAVDKVSFQVYSGETLGLVGESGCGKTSLSRTILKLLEPTSGQIFFRGKEITQLNRKELKGFRKNAQIIFQDPYSSLNPDMTIGNALIEPLKVHKLFKSRKERTEFAASVLMKTGLSGDDLKKYPHQFSGGQRQRIVIARALILQPQLIICDEAVSALDVSVQAQVLNLLNDLKDEFGLTYLFISHDLSVVRYMSDRIMVMQKGKIVECGDADQVLSSPEHEYTQMLLDSVPGRRKLSIS